MENGQLLHTVNLQVTNPIIFGMACECDNFRCDIDDDGNVCGGESTSWQAIDWHIHAHVVPPSLVPSA